MIKSIISGFGRTLGRFLFYVLLGLLAYLIFDNWEVKASTLTDFDLVSGTFTCNDSWYDNPTVSNGSTYYQLRHSKGCIVTKQENYDYLIIQPSFSVLYKYDPYIATNIYEYNNTILEYDTRVFISYNNTTRYCQQEKTYSICNINNLPDNTVSTISIIIGVDIPFNQNLYNGQKQDQQYDINTAISPLINYGRLYNQQMQEIVNQNTSIIQNQVEINNSLNDDSTLPSTDVSSITDIGIGSDITGNARFSDIVLLAPQVLQHLLINNNTCVQVNLGQLYGTNLYLPCIQPASFLGSSIWGVIDVIFCIALLFPFIQWLVQTIYKIIGLDRLDPTFGFSEAVNK